MMMRLLFWIALIVLVVMAVRSKAKGVLRQHQQPQQPKAEPEAETMSRCAHCGIHFPASEAVRADGLDYCSPAHVRLPPR
jgi:uncharacterized protein